jgi:hypothetical protein
MAGLFRKLMDRIKPKKDSEDYIIDLQGPEQKTTGKSSSGEKSSGGGSETSSVQSASPTRGIQIGQPLRKEFDASFGFFRFNFTTNSKAKRLVKWEARAKEVENIGGPDNVNNAKAIRQLINEYLGKNPKVKDKYDIEKKVIAAMNRDRTVVEASRKNAEVSAETDSKRSITQQARTPSQAVVQAPTFRVVGEGDHNANAYDEIPQVSGPSMTADPAEQPSPTRAVGQARTLLGGSTTKFADMPPIDMEGPKPGSAQPAPPVEEEPASRMQPDARSSFESVKIDADNNDVFAELDKLLESLPPSDNASVPVDPKSQVGPEELGKLLASLNDDTDVPTLPSKNAPEVPPLPSNYAPENPPLPSQNAEAHSFVEGHAHTLFKNNSHEHLRDLAKKGEHSDAGQDNKKGSSGEETKSDDLDPNPGSRGPGT